VREPRIVDAGDGAVTIEFAERIDLAVNAQAIALATAVKSAGIPGVRDVVPAYRSVTVFFDPLKTDYDKLVTRLELDARQNVDMVTSSRPAIEIPVCYGGRFGPDLAEVASFGNIAPDEVIRLHASTIYRVFMLGFVPGFAYLGLVHETIAAPRRPNPRIRVPHGSVGIAGAQTWIYPTETPGGWQLVGRTPLKPFDMGREEPFLMRPGDAVQFYAIDESEFDRLQDRANSR
jgi:KipI family sensor histidine kinase inhibitor